jgi:hypothetical protein
VIRTGVDAYQLMHGVGNLCTGADADARYDPRQLVALLVPGMRRTQ